VIGALAISLAFAPVRTFAVQVLSIFRVQKIATVSITSADLEQMSASLQKGDAHVSLKELGDVWVDGSPSIGGQEASATTLAKAQATVDFPLLVPAGVEGSQTVLTQPGGTIKFKLHVDKVNELLKYYGADKLLSSSVDGKEFSITMPPTVYIGYGADQLGFVNTDGGDPTADNAGSSSPDPSTQSVFVVQTRGPQLSVPAGVDPLEIRDVLLGLPFMPQDLRTQLAGVNDWQSTLIVPNISGSTHSVTVAGHQGVAIGEPIDPAASPQEAADSESPHAIMWQQDGVLRAVATTSEAQSLSIAESMAR
jgi:hypothetical protein